MKGSYSGIIGAGLLALILTHPEVVRVAKIYVRISGLGRALPSIRPPGCSKVEGVQYCEDVHYEPKTDVFFLSCDPYRREWNTVMGTTFNATRGHGDIYIYDPRTRASPTKLPIEGLSTIDFHPLGISYLWDQENQNQDQDQDQELKQSGKLHLFVINHRISGPNGSSGNTVERFVVRRDDATGFPIALVHERTFATSEHIHTPNSLVPLSLDRFIVTNDHLYYSGALKRLETMGIQPWSYISHVDGDHPQQSYQLVSNITFANGIARTHAAAAAAETPATNENVLLQEQHDSHPAPTLDLFFVAECTSGRVWVYHHDLLARADADNARGHRSAGEEDQQHLKQQDKSNATKALLLKSRFTSLGYVEVPFAVDNINVANDPETPFSVFAGGHPEAFKLLIFARRESFFRPGSEVVQISIDPQIALQRVLASGCTLSPDSSSVEAASIVCNTERAQSYSPISHRMKYIFQDDGSTFSTSTSAAVGKGPHPLLVIPGLYEDHIVVCNDPASLPFS